MSREKHHHKKKHHTGGTKENEDKNERPKSRLFTEADAQAAELSDYTMNPVVYQIAPSIQEPTIPLGVVGVDESFKLPTASPKSHHHDSRSRNTLQSSENHRKEHVHLPPISNHHYPYEYYNPSYNYHPYPIHYEHRSPYYHHHHHHHNHNQHHHHNHHHHRHHKHEKEVETYDPRWWYMPINAVHGPKPKPKLSSEYHYVAPKWYESPSRQSRMMMISQESKSSAQKYIDCRCEVCRPSKETPRGTKWVVNE